MRPRPAPETTPDTVLSPGGRLPDLTRTAILWTEALHGTAPLRDALDHVAGATGAASAVLYRWCARTRRPRIIATFDRDASQRQTQGIHPIRHPLGPDLIPVDLHRARPGSVWRLEDAGRHARDCLDDRQARSRPDRGLVDLVAIPLGQSGGMVDVLELGLDRRAPAGLRAALGDLALVLAFAWGRRPRGRVSGLLAGGAGPRTPDPAGQRTAPLSIGNPWKLTPTEMRICHLIREGQDPARLVALIGVAESTLRSHLRSIYAKAGVTGQLGLVRLLLADAPARQA